MWLLISAEVELSPLNFDIFQKILISSSLRMVGDSAMFKLMNTKISVDIYDEMIT
jgi:hypothetical protein